MALTTHLVVTEGRRPGQVQPVPDSSSDLGDEQSPPEEPTDAGLVEAGIERESTSGSKRRSWGRRYAARVMITDLLALFWAAVGVHLVRPLVNTNGLSPNLSFIPFLALTAVLLVAWMMALVWSGSHDPKAIGYGATEYKQVIHATLIVFGAAAIASYLFQLELPRSYLVIMMPAGLGAVLLDRYIWRRWLHRQRDVGQFMSQVLAVGNIHTVTELLRDLRLAPRAGYKVIGVCISQDVNTVDHDGGALISIDGVPVLGDLTSIAEVARQSRADTVAVTATAAFGPSAVRRLSWALEDTDAELVLAPALTNIAGPRIHTQPVAGLPLIHVDRPTYRGANRILKKTFDAVTSVLLVLLLSPVLLAVAVAVKATSKGPVFFRQERVGINGETFRMIKFRSMVVDAEARLASLKAEQHDAGNEVLFKIKNDPRITKVGKFIRRFSIDELPQLFNVVIGDMSLVGPRPPLTAEVELYGDEARRRLLVKPGMTGLWQVSGRSDLTWEDTVRLDVYYVENWSITGDVVILWKTAKAVVSSSGAY
jgi:exopolysaccharide biosynthesis polyprenyl glycosylphosphotransferase